MWDRKHVPPNSVSADSTDPTEHLKQILHRVHDPLSLPWPISSPLRPTTTLPVFLLASASHPDPGDPRSTDQGIQLPAPLGSSRASRMAEVADAPRHATSSSPPPPGGDRKRGRSSPVLPPPPPGPPPPEQHNKRYCREGGGFDRRRLGGGGGGFEHDDRR
jgi:hypothetical protein